MITAACWLAVVLYLIPLACVLTAYARRDLPSWEIGLLIPAAVAVDIATLATASRVVSLEVAVLVSRPLWLIVTAAVIYGRKLRPAFLSTYEIEGGWLQWLEV